MEYQQYGDTFYVRMDKGDEIITNLLNLCQEQHIASCTYSGIGGCSSAEIQTFIPQTGTFETRLIEGMLELASFTGNIITDQSGELRNHSHGVFAYKVGERHEVAAGHLNAVVVLYTAEITLKPVVGGTIYQQYDEETETGFWKLHE
ncbi:hypothetical protein D2E26_0550 [Bifidobacterium dolichotidis]|uniref:PPC domain-containing protein n=1 Tax=Bifidobacterium dolichotidis TaxID=2306976 RepID=A0A430FT41_9BIFI|nr:PPC domain-containing DNA-binding protein [Bifidobacterium dolichotidis]RSX55987.1 hypothetical protein D2E26_0550 [Bifidobacterium dolichotidis]